MENYKGIYYNEEKEPKLYEGGAHFKYKNLFKILLSLGGVLVDDDSHHSISKYKKNEHIKSNKDINSLLIKVREKKSKYKTRNLAALIYDNNPNPNTQIKHGNKLNTKNSLSIKDFNSRNNNKARIMNKKYSYYKKAITSVSINNLHKKKTRINNDLITIILRKKEIDNKIYDKSNDSNINNNNNKHFSLFNYSRYIHNRNRSESFSNINSTFNHNISNSQRFENEDKTFMKSIDNKILVNKKNKFNTHNTNNKEVNGKENNIKNENDKPKIKIKIKKYPLVYGKTKINIFKENSKMNNQLSFYANKTKKSRNNIYKKIIDSKSTFENNKTKNDNYQKKLIKKGYFNKKEKNKEDKNKEDINKEDKNKEDKKNITNKTFNNNISCLNSNRFKEFNIKNKEKILKSNGNTNLVQKYIKKKIKQLCVFNHNNIKMKKISKSIDQE